MLAMGISYGMGNTESLCVALSLAKLRWGESAALCSRLVFQVQGRIMLIKSNDSHRRSFHPQRNTFVCLLIKCWGFVCCDRTRGNDFELKERRFRLDRGKKVWHWGRWGSGTGCPERRWCPVPADSQGQAGRGSERCWSCGCPWELQGVAPGGLWGSLPTQMVLWFYDLHYCEVEIQVCMRPMSLRSLFLSLHGKHLLLSFPCTRTQLLQGLSREHHSALTQQHSLSQGCMLQLGCWQITGGKEMLSKEEKCAFKRSHAIMEAVEPGLDAISLRSALLLWGSCWAGCSQCFNEKFFITFKWTYLNPRRHIGCAHTERQWDIWLPGGGGDRHKDSLDAITGRATLLELSLTCPSVGHGGWNRQEAQGRHR